MNASFKNMNQTQELKVYNLAPFSATVGPSKPMIHTSLQVKSTVHRVREV